MSIVPASFMVLRRAKNALKEAYSVRDWEQIHECDQFVGVALTQAFDDPERDPAALSRELNSVLELYSAIVGSMPEQVQSKIGQPEFCI